MPYFVLLSAFVLFHVDTEPIPSDKLFKEWSDLLAPVPVEGALKNLLSFFDPRGDNAFIKFTDERLDTRIIRDTPRAPSAMVTSSDWFAWMLQAQANPLANAEAKPSAYSLPPERNRLSLLRFNGKIGDYQASFTESVNGVVIEVPLSKDLQAKGIRKQDLFLLLRNTVSEKYIGNQEPQIIEQGDKLCKPGYVLSSIDVGDSLAKYQTKKSWPIVALLSNRSIMIFFLKPTPASLNNMMAFGGRYDEKEWLPQYLADKDGKLLVEKLFGPGYLQLNRGPK